ncbi:hypothetical protein DFJ63DRAFT_27951 [Scheffersomyces coipomensis]|uniref:uncharacterized protein n=1 Tax=Scheffersomyces coipomensis TaxID=1788519 RepID=UPI00315CE264
MSDPSQRIISHMNADHQLALIDYIVVYGGAEIGLFQESSVKLVKLDEKSFTIEYSLNTGEIVQYSLDWNDASESQHLKVESFKDIKDKLISMAKYAAAKQGYSAHRITKILLPDNIFGYGMYVTVITLFLNTVDPNLIPKYLGNDFIYGQIVKYIPTFVKKNIPFIFYLVTLIHVFEVMFVLVPKLKKYRVSTVQSFGWIVMNMFEGFNVYFRFNTLTKD